MNFNDNQYDEMAYQRKRAMLSNAISILIILAVLLGMFIIGSSVTRVRIDTNFIDSIHKTQYHEPTTD